MNTKRIYAFLASGIFLGISAFLFSKFLAYHEAKVDLSGILFKDVVMDLFPIADVSAFIFGITYGSIALYAILEFKKPLFATKLMVTYGILLLTRIVTLTLLPLKEPETLVYLSDPFLNNLIYPGEIDADLFFSGHAGLLFSLFFLSRKWVFAILGVILSVLLMVQRVHYSIDVIAAVPFAYIIVRSAEFITSRGKNT
jgi:membrane-associated phospholipid phosphatase